MNATNINSPRKRALVTGASSGIGFAIARALASDGYDLIIVSRSPERLEAARQQLAVASVDVVAHAIDLATPTAADELYGWVTAQGYEVDVLVNDAGMFIFNDVLQTEPERIERIINLHIRTLTTLCRLFASDMVGRGSGHILNLSSYSVWMPFPGLGLYAATKAYVKTFSAAMSKELRGSGVTLTAVSPAGVATDLYGLSDRMQRLGLRCGVLISPDSVARRSLRAMFRGRTHIVPDWWNRLWIPFFKYMGSSTTRLIRRRTMKFQK